MHSMEEDCKPVHLHLHLHLNDSTAGIEINFFTHKQIFACDHFFHKQKCNIQNFQQQYFFT